MARKSILLLTALCLAFAWVWGGFASPLAVAQGIKYGQANQQDMVRRGQELNRRARQDTREATQRMRQILQEKRDGQRGLSSGFMDRHRSGNSNSRRR